jgi:hypothetical protein
VISRLARKLVRTSMLIKNNNNKIESFVYFNKKKIGYFKELINIDFFYGFYRTKQGFKTRLTVKKYIFMLSCTLSHHHRITLKIN